MDQKFNKKLIIKITLSLKFIYNCKLKENLLVVLLKFYYFSMEFNFFVNIKIMNIYVIIFIHDLSIVLLS